MKKFSLISGRRKKLVETIILLGIISLSFFLRIYKLGENPPSLNWDEVSHGYNAYSILKTGKDEWGFKFPLIFRSFGDYKLPLYIYLSVINISIFGLNAFSIRLLSVFCGTGLVIMSYLITEKIVKNNLLSLLAALLTAVSPWSLFLSRVAVEANLSAFLFSLGIYYFLDWFNKSSKNSLFKTGLFWGLSMFAYNSARVVVPLFSILLFLSFAKKKTLKQSLGFFFIIVFFLVLVGFQFINKSAGARFDLVSLIDQGVINQIAEARNNSGLPSLVNKAVFNRVNYFIYLSARNYLSNLSPIYLFFKGGSHYQFSLPGLPLLYLVTAPFLLLGFITLVMRRSRTSYFLLCWFFLSFVPSAITRDAPHALRSILFLPLPMIITAVGLDFFVGRLKEESLLFKNIILGIIVFAVFVSFLGWWRAYWIVFPQKYSWAWQYGYKEAVEFIKEYYPKYDQIYFTKKYGEPHEFVLFYWPWAPEKYQTDPQKKWDYHDHWYWVDSFDKFIFVNDWEIIEKSKIKNQKSKITGENEKTLLITSPGNYPEGWNKIKTINFLDGNLVFDILEY